ncbi:glycosyltransferase family protein [Agromyces cerinus]|uniref:Glycosyltransferase involved in cell wall bisynthesis n=1 Tax=Agromyces cerinus subsp. cerinus TaxID=232089 RepID=A0A1N6F602_9MICO|nr:hypothetical protein [Agromyces cerinus]SIN90680.1 Glycosyltransferase involved in cell wall bisynthesis [Agromyces cerinus subsp. cerinus]
MNARPRVLVQLDNLELGGAQINAVQLSAAVSVHGFDSLLIGPEDTLPVEGPSLLDIARDYGVQLEVYRRPAPLMAHARTISRLADRWEADLVHAFSSSERAAYWGAGLFGRRALVRTIYENSYDPRTHPSVPVVIGTGYLRDQLADRPGGAILISPPVDTSRDASGVTDRESFRRRLGVAGDAVVLVIVSRVATELKGRGIEDAICAVESANDPRIHLIVVGTGDAEERLRGRAAAVNARLGRSAIVFFGPMSDPRPVYDAADVVLGMGSSAARGLAFGKPLIVLGERGWSAIFRPPDTEAILHNNFWSPQSVTDGAGMLLGHIRELVDHPADRVALGRTARQFAEEHFGLPTMALRLAGVYEGALESRSASAWLGDLRMEARILAAKAERTAGRMSGGRFSGGRASASLAWNRHGPDGTLQMVERTTR